MVTKHRADYIDLYGRAGIPTLEEIWLIYNANAHCTLRSVQYGQEYVMLTFPCPALNIIFFPSDVIFYNTFNKLSTKDWGVILYVLKAI